MNRAARWAIVLIAGGVVQTVQAQTVTTLDDFIGANGGSPSGTLVQATNGELYGTTLDGGSYGSGTVFKVTTGGQLITLYSFCSQSGCPDGASPGTGLLQAGNGDLYGTTFYGGANDRGTIFSITPSGALSTLYSFCQKAGCADGEYPEGALIQATNGLLYGTTEYGGAYGYGTVFNFAGGTLTTLHNFKLTDGFRPGQALTQADNGNFYGTTYAGGASKACSTGCGTIFEITASGSLSTLHSFVGTDGANPGARLVQAADGNLYGTTLGSLGPNKGGTAFVITLNGTLTTLYQFCLEAGCVDGNIPSSLLQAADGNFYGIAYEGGASGDGTIFKLNSSGDLTTLYSFCAQAGCTDGGNPIAGLTQDTNGEFFGTTFAGGTDGDGTVYSLSVGLGPFVETQSTLGEVGSVVKILGNGLRSTTGVTFNGTPAIFKIVSATELTATVPSGASSGIVAVTTPGGVLQTIKNYTVIP